jgi:hypothetical protein
MSAIIVPRPGPISTSLNDEHADHFTEQLADFGRGHEIAGTAEGFARLVIAVFRIGQAERKEIGHADRAIRLDDRLDLLTECGGHGSPPPTASVLQGSLPAGTEHGPSAK